MIPVAGAIEAFLTIYNNLPYSVSAFINLSLGLFFIVSLIRVILRL